MSEEQDTATIMCPNCKEVSLQLRHDGSTCTNCRITYRQGELTSKWQEVFDPPPQTKDDLTEEPKVHICPECSSTSLIIADEIDRMVCLQCAFVWSGLNRCMRCNNYSNDFVGDSEVCTNCYDEYMNNPNT